MFFLLMGLYRNIVVMYTYLRYSLQYLKIRVNFLYVKTPEDHASGVAKIRFNDSFDRW